jgi:NAD(P)H-hydrate epimerase
MKLVSVAEMQAIERAADASGLTYAEMMENAGRGLAEVLKELFADVQQPSAMALVGSGNNGGDALVALAHLAQAGWRVLAYLVRPRKKKDPLIQRLKDAGGELTSAEEDNDIRQLTSALQAHDVLLDGVLGTGIKLPLKDQVAVVLDAVRQTIAVAPNPPLVVAVDCPSGVDCASGEVAQETIPADVTVTMAAVKEGLLRLPAYGLLGELRLVDIGLSPKLKPWKAVHRFVADEHMVHEVLPARPLDAHKGTFGTALVIAGSVNYTGAAALAGEAAYRSGAGLVTLAVPFPLHSALAGTFPEATWLLLPHELGVISEDAAQVVLEHLQRVTAMLVGPGFGLEETTGEFIRHLFGVEDRGRHPIGFVPSAEKEGTAKSAKLPPLVLDADGLKLIAQISNWPEVLPKPAVLTPHPGEMAVLTGLEKKEIQAERMAIAEKYAQQWGHVVVLKGAFSVVASPEGESTVIPVATPALARAGTGDVLAGLIVGLMAQGVAAYPAAIAGAWIHAQAGLLAAELMGNTASVLAGDVLALVPEVINRLGE